jgi:hypothetical protein
VAVERDQPIRDLSDAFLDSFEVKRGRLTFRVHTWDDKLVEFVADDVDLVSDNETSSLSAIVRVTALDKGSRKGFGLANADGATTFSFRARDFAPDPASVDETPRIAPHIRRVGDESV